MKGTSSSDDSKNTKGKTDTNKNTKDTSKDGKTDKTTKDDKKAKGGNTMVILGSVAVGALVLGAGFYFYKKKSGEDHEGGEDDLYSKFLSTELSA